MDLLIKLQKIDRRIIYALVVVVLMLPLIFHPAGHPTLVTPEVHDAFDVIDQVPKDKMVILSSAWGPSTEYENGPQTAALMHHMLLKGIRFGIVSWDPQGAQLTYNIGNNLQTELHKQYGVDWVHFGYKVLIEAALRGIGTNLPKTMETDMNGTRLTDLSKLPVMKGIRDSRDIGAVVEISASGTLEGTMTYMTQPNNLPLLYCPTAVMSVEAYRYLDSRQLKGMLNSAVGAAQYETLIGLSSFTTPASVTTWALSTAHIFIIVLILLGNLGYFASKKAARRQGGEANND